jgi:hypothetical protein
MNPQIRGESLGLPRVAFEASDFIDGYCQNPEFAGRGLQPDEFDSIFTMCVL